jgi:hypothetical protein
VQSSGRAASSLLRQSVLERRREGVNVCFIEQLPYPLVRDLDVIRQQDSSASRRIRAGRSWTIS